MSDRRLVSIAFATLTLHLATVVSHFRGLCGLSFHSREALSVTTSTTGKKHALGSLSVWSIFLAVFQPQPGHFRIVFPRMSFDPRLEVGFAFHSVPAFAI